MTWAWERQPRASTVWDQVLAEAGVPPAPLRRVDSGLDQPGAVDALLRSAGLRPERIWHDRLHHEWDQSSFWELASGSGSNRIRLSQLGSAARAGVLARLTSTLSQLGPGDFVWEGEVICAVATKDSLGTDHPGKEPLPGARPIWNSLMAASGARRRSFLQCGIQRQATPAGWPSITAGRISRESTDQPLSRSLRTSPENERPNRCSAAQSWLGLNGGPRADGPVM